MLHERCLCSWVKLEGEAPWVKTHLRFFGVVLKTGQRRDAHCDPHENPSALGKTVQTKGCSPTTLTVALNLPLLPSASAVNLTNIFCSSDTNLEGSGLPLKGVNSVSAADEPACRDYVLWATRRSESFHSGWFRRISLDACQNGHSNELTVGDKNLISGAEFQVHNIQRNKRAVGA